MSDSGEEQSTSSFAPIKISKSKFSIGSSTGSGSNACARNRRRRCCSHITTTPIIVVYLLLGNSVPHDR
jgi:hypothetical protein